MPATSTPAASTTAPAPDPTLNASGGAGGTEPAPSTTDEATGGTGGGTEPAPSSSEGTTGGAGGMGSMPATGEFTLTIGELDVHDNEACSHDSCGTCETYPADNVSICKGADTSPLITWTAGPEGTVGYAVVLRDMSKDLNHWAIWNIPASVTSLPAAFGTPSGDFAEAVQKSFSAEQYVGSGACDHVYEFRVYALTETISDTNLGSVVTALSGGDNPQSFVRLRSICSEECRMGPDSAADAPMFMPNCTP
jgi:phosphatidylethanolamine-binding protein (PEBP) family uncharacterized protein